MNNLVDIKLKIHNSALLYQTINEYKPNRNHMKIGKNKRYRTYAKIII